VEAQLIGDLVAGCAVLDREGLTTAFGHLSARAADGAIVISANPGPGLVRDAHDLIALSPDGSQCDTGDRALVPGEAAIHLRIFARRADVVSVCRFHGPSCMAFSTLGRPLTAAIGMGLFVGAQVPWFDTATTITEAEDGDRLAECLEGGAAVLLRGFGAVTVGRSVREAVVRAWMLERSAAATIAAAGIAEPLAYPEPAATPFLAASGPAQAQISRAWNYLCRSNSIRQEVAAT
jgi:ribulose-5-phosphate 4-epimerase/fuculose-1-phosphate aldolase